MAGGSPTSPGAAASTMRFRTAANWRRPMRTAKTASLKADGEITHVAVVHCETTTGMLNPVEAIGGIVKAHGTNFIVDAMSSFGGIPMDVEKMGADYLISSANKCIQGVPGFGFVIAKQAVLERTRGPGTLFEPRSV
jgi:2-aminoethylphosphonate-pyruvate transaminase